MTNNKLQKATKNFIILTMSGGEYIINEEQYEKLLMAPPKSNVRLGSNLINSSSISEVVELNDYYFQHPEKRPARELETFEGMKRQEFSDERRIKAYGSFLKGFNKSVSEQGYPMSEKQKQILDKVKKIMSQIGGEANLGKALT